MVLRIRAAEQSDLDILVKMAVEKGQSDGRDARSVKELMEGTMRDGKSFNYLVVEEDVLGGARVTDIHGYVAVQYNPTSQRIIIRGPVLETYTEIVAVSAIVAAEDVWKRRIAVTGVFPTTVIHRGREIAALYNFGYQRGGGGSIKDISNTEYVRTTASFTILGQNIPLNNRRVIPRVKR